MDVGLSSVDLLGGPRYLTGMWFALIIAFTEPALAQDPSPPAAAPSTTHVWVETVTPLLRWPDAELSVGDTALYEKLEIVTRKDDMIRVRRGMTFGWLPADTVSAQAPVAETTAEETAPLIQLGGSLPPMFGN